MYIKCIFNKQSFFLCCLYMLKAMFQNKIGKYDAEKDRILPLCQKNMQVVRPLFPRRPPLAARLALKLLLARCYYLFTVTITTSTTNTHTVGKSNSIGITATYFTSIYNFYTTEY